MGGVLCTYSGHHIERYVLDLLTSFTQIHPLVWGLVALSCANGFYTITRTRKYRLFEANVEVKPSTPSVRRVKVSSSPGRSSPLRYIADMMTPESAESRAHPNKAEDVWELSVWDPLPICLRLFCLFSPGHVLVHLMFLPLAPMETRPSVTVFNTILIQVVLSCQLLFLASRFSQQAKDNAIIQKEVLHEYDTKFVHPRIHPVVREVGTQVSEDHLGQARGFVQAGTPTTLIHRSFHTRKNQYSGSEDGTPSRGSSNVMNPKMFTPTHATRRSDAHITPDHSRPSTARKSLPAGYVSSVTPTPVIPASSTTGNLNFGGNMGVYTHNNSPLKKATSLNDMNGVEQPSPRNSREMASYEQTKLRNRRQSSPVKQSEIPGSARPNPFAPPRPRSQFERYPSLR